MDFKDVLKNVPTPEGGDYLANGKGERVKGRRLRLKILKFCMKLLLDLDIFVKLNSFLGRLHKADFCLRVKSVFLRYYNADSDSLSFPWHIENAFATIIITMPSPSFSSHNNLAVEVIDPMFLQEV